MNITVKPSDLLKLLPAILPQRRSVFIWGAPGIGKSTVVKKVADDLGANFIDLRGSQLESIDLRGLPRVINDQTTYARPTFLPASGKHVLFLDELPQAEQDVQKGFMQLCNDRRIGEHVLPDDCYIVAAGNRQADRAGANRVLSALQNRFVHYELEVSNDDWMAWALDAGIRPEVRSYIGFAPAALFEFDPTTNPRSFPTPRSWHFLSDLLGVTPPELLHATACGCVGEARGSAFIAHYKMYGKLPNPDDVLAKPSTFSIPTEPSVLHALCGALVERVKQDNTKAAALAAYGMRLPDEFSALAVRDAFAIDRGLARDKDIQKWVAQARSKGLFLGS